MVWVHVVGRYPFADVLESLSEVVARQADIELFLGEFRYPSPDGVVSRVEGIPTHRDRSVQYPLCQVSGDDGGILSPALARAARMSNMTVFESSMKWTFSSGMRFRAEYLSAPQHCRRTVSLAVSSISL